MITKMALEVLWKTVADVLLVGVLSAILGGGLLWFFGNVLLGNTIAFVEYLRWAYIATVAPSLIIRWTLATWKLAKALGRAHSWHVPFNDVLEGTLVFKLEDAVKTGRVHSGESFIAWLQLSRGMRTSSRGFSRSHVA